LPKQFRSSRPGLLNPDFVFAYAIATISSGSGLSGPDPQHTIPVLRQAPFSLAMPLMRPVSIRQSPACEPITRIPAHYVASYGFSLQSRQSPNWRRLCVFY
jgi:hypothetical protein